MKRPSLKSQTALIVFVKKSVPGQVKTRLAKTIGNEQAARVYEHLLTYTSQLSIEVKNVTVLIFHDELPDSLPLKWKPFENRTQSTGNLGAKLLAAFKECFDCGFQRVICIGSDCISIQPSDINEACTVLEHSDVVFGPATDGGYYLIGMNQWVPQIFEDMPWSQSSLLQYTLEKCKSTNHTYHLLRELSDIDTAEDLIHLKSELQAFDPVFFSFIDQMNYI